MFTIAKLEEIADRLEEREFLEDRDVEEYYTKEIELVRANYDCEGDYPGVLRTNFDAISKLSIKDSMDPNVMKSVACSVHKATFLPREARWSRFLMKKSIARLAPMGEFSSFGSTYFLHMTKDKDGTPIIAKTSQYLRMSQHMIHELAVGYLATNQLREYTPNFAYVYGGFDCNSGIINKDRASGYCSSAIGRSDQMYVMYENISPSYTLYDVYKNKLLGEELEETIGIVLQIACALSIAYDKARFTHYDLHGHNVLLRELPEVHNIKYDIGGEDIYVKSKYVVTFIDYGHASFRFGPRKTYGNIEAESGGTTSFSAFPFADAVKIIHSLAIAVMIKYENPLEDIKSMKKLKKDETYVFLTGLLHGLIKEKSTKKLMEYISSRSSYMPIPTSRKLLTKFLWKDMFKIMHNVLISELGIENGIRDMIDLDDNYPILNTGEFLSSEEAIAKYRTPYKINDFVDLYIYHTYYGKDMANYDLTPLIEYEKNHISKFIDEANKIDKRALMTPMIVYREGVTFTGPLPSDEEDDPTLRDVFETFDKDKIFQIIKLVAICEYLSNIFTIMNELEKNNYAINGNFIDIHQRYVVMYGSVDEVVRNFVSIAGKKNIENMHPVDAKKLVNILDMVGFDYK